MLTRLELNYDLSKKIFDARSAEIKKKQCYRNIYNIVICSDYIGKFKKGLWRVAYGAMPIGDSLAARHCFIADGDKAIDPTAFAINSKNEDALDNCVYYAFKVFDSLDDYLNALIKDNGDLSLDRFLRKESNNAFYYLQKRGIYMLG